MKVPKQCVPLYVGVTVLGLGLSLGYNCGYAVNPARDVAPRIFTALAGWGPAVFTAYNYWWVVPVIACHAGAVAGAWTYYLAVEIHWPAEEKYDSVGTHSEAADNNYEKFENGYAENPSAPYQVNKPGYERAAVAAFQEELSGK